MVHRLLAAAEGYAPLPTEYTDKEFMSNATDVGSFINILISRL